MKTAKGLAKVVSCLPIFMAISVIQVLPAQAKDAGVKPNLLVIMSDDQGQWAMGSSGLEHIQTPNLDFLADQGVRFENAMTPAPVCSAARASFNTGKMPSQHGVFDFLSESEPVGFDHDWLEGETLLSERLKAAGYRTALFGKWHASNTGMAPVRGFDRWLSHDAKKAGWRTTYLHSGTVHFSDDGKALSHTGVQARFLTEHAIEFMDQKAKEPFYINLNFMEPHFPFEGLPERLVSRYRHVAKNIIRDGGSSKLAAMNEHTLVPENHEESLAQYLAAVSLVDDQIGRLLDALDSRGLTENTLIFFVSDHGYLMGQYGLYGKVNASFPYNFYEETVRIPFVVHGPSEFVRPAQVRQEFVDLLDLHTTILDFAGGGRTIDTSYGPGRSIRKLLRGERTIDWRDFQFAERGNGRMISNGHWKLVRYYPRDKSGRPQDHWYDLSSPLGERNTSPPPRESVRILMENELEGFFAKYSTEEHSGRNIWQQPAPNVFSEKLQNDALWN